MDRVPGSPRKRTPSLGAIVHGAAPLLPTFLALGLLACSPSRVMDGAYVNPTAGIRVPAPPAPWVPVELPDVEAAFRRPGTAAIIAILSECQDTGRAPMRILARRLLFGLRSEVVEQAPISVDGAEALRTVARGTLDGRPVVVESLSVRRGHCVSDLVLAAPPGEFDSVRPDFDRMMAGLRALP